MNIRENNFYEIDNDVDTMNLIKAQNKKINELYENISFKENIIANLKKENYLINEYAYENDDLKNKISSLEKHVDISKVTAEEKENFIQKQIQQITELERHVNSKLNHKEKVITEKENIIIELRNNLKKQRNEIENQSERNNKLAILNDELNMEIKNHNILLEINQNEIEKYKKKFEDQQTENENLKKSFDAKVLELVDLIKSQNTELNNLSIKLNNEEKENIGLKDTITELEKELDLLNANLYEMNNNLQNQNNLIENYKKSEKALYNTENELAFEKEKVAKLTHDLNNISEAFESIRNQYSGENSLENLYNIIATKDQQIFNLQKTIETQNQILTDKDSFLKENEAEILEFVKYINQFLSTASAWADTYFGVYADKNISNLNIPDLNYQEFDFNCNSKFLNQTTNKGLEAFSENLNKIRLRIHDDLHFFNESFAKTNSENKQVLETFKKMNDEIYTLKNDLEKSQSQNLVDKNNLNNMRNDLKFYHDKINSLEKICEQENNISKKILADVQKEYEILYEIIRSNTKFKCYAEYLAGFKLEADSNIIAQNIIDTFRCICELNKIILKDFEQNFKKLDDLQILKKECDEIRRDFIETNKINKATIDNLKSENAELRNNYEHTRNNQISKLEESFKQKIEHLRVSIKEKEENNMILSQDNTILRSQLEILEKNLNNHKYNSKETEDFLQNKINELTEYLKDLENNNTQIKNEYDLLQLKYENSEIYYKKKILELEESKKKFYDIQTNFNFYSEKSINNQMKLINNEKEKIEQMTKEIDRLKNENKALMENNMNLKEEAKKFLDSKSLNNLNSRVNKNFGQDEQMEILLKGYKEQMKKYEEELRIKDVKISTLLKEGNSDQNRSFNSNSKIRSIDNINNTPNYKNTNMTIENNIHAENNENVINNEFFEHKGFLSNLNSFVIKESQV